MKRRHFDGFRPDCPVCRAASASPTEAPLRVARVIRGDDDDILEGVLHCSNASCQREFPIVDGVPLIIADLRTYLSNSVFQVLVREDLSSTTESMLGDCCGPGSAFDVTRSQVSSYAWDHYADLDPQEPSSNSPPAAAVRLQTRALEAAGSIGEGRRVDLGCGPGRTTFELAARGDDLVLGVDLNFAMLRVASHVLRKSSVRYARRRVGMVYDRREFSVDFAKRSRVDFWACDASCLPLADRSLALASCLNLLDCVASPHELLVELARVLKPGGKALVACPYDWSTSATPMEAWLGGHSQRGPDAGASEPMLRALLTPGGHPMSISGLAIRAEEDGLPWRVRLHDRSVVEYQTHLIVAEAVADD